MGQPVGLGSWGLTIGGKMSDCGKGRGIWAVGSDVGADLGRAILWA